MYNIICTDWVYVLYMVCEHTHTQVSRGASFWFIMITYIYYYNIVLRITPVSITYCNIHYYMLLSRTHTLHTHTRRRSCIIIIIIIIYLHCCMIIKHYYLYYYTKTPQSVSCLFTQSCNSIFHIFKRTIAAVYYYKPTDFQKVK